jgi:hypothetical protein
VGRSNAVRHCPGSPERWEYRLDARRVLDWCNTLVIYCGFVSGIVNESRTPLQQS